MNDMIEHFRTVLRDRPTDADLEPRRYKRRQTWVPVAGDKVTIYRAMHDPDRDITHNGVYAGETDDTYRIHVEGEEFPSAFAKRNDHGNILWRLDSRGHRTLPPHI